LGGPAVLTWIVVAALLSVVLGPVVDLAERRLHLRRAVAILLVFLLFLIALAGIVTVFIRPLATEGPEFIDRLPGYVEDARAGRTQAILRARDAGLGHP
jgi:predicted PurR-regulated permease PerM